MQTMKTRYWTIVEIAYTGDSDPDDVREAVYDKIVETIDIDEIPDISFGGGTGGPVGALTATVKAGTPLEALGFMAGTLRSALEASGPGESWDMPGAVMRVAPAKEAHRTYEPLDDRPRYLPHGYVGGPYGRG
jgi:hypothetical protein